MESRLHHTKHLLVFLCLIVQVIFVLRVDLPFFLDWTAPTRQAMANDELLIASAHQEEIPQQSNQTIESQQQQPKKRSMLHGRTFQDTWNASHTNSSHEDGIEVPHTFVPPVEMWLRDSPLQNQTSIPKVIYKMILSHQGTFPNFQNQSPQLRAAHESWLIRNPGYELRYFHLVQVRQYLRDYFHPVFLRAFDCIVAYAGKSDFFRVAVLYRDGGWYSDWKEVCLEDHLLDSLSANNKTLVFGWDRGTPHSRQNACVMNAFLGATERDPSKLFLVGFLRISHSMAIVVYLVKCWKIFFVVCCRTYKRLITEPRPNQIPALVCWENRTRPW